MVFQVDSEPIADMNWFWLEQKGFPREAFLLHDDALDLRTEYQITNRSWKRSAT